MADRLKLSGMDAGWLLWIVSGIVMLLLEFSIPGLIIFFFGIGGILTGILALLIPGFSQSILLQVLTWLGTSTFTLAFLRKKLSSVFKGDAVKAGSELDDQSDAGQIAEVLETITPQKAGRISLHGTSWEARSYTEKFERGTKVQILSREGMRYYVSAPIDTFEDSDEAELKKLSDEASDQQ